MGRRSNTAASGTELAQLRTAVEQLIDHVACLTAAVDDLTDHVKWCNNNAAEGDGPVSPRFALTSLSRDAAAEGFSVNSVPDEILDQLRDRLADPARDRAESLESPSETLDATRSQSRLFE